MSTRRSKRAAGGDEFWTRHLSVRARILFFAGVFTLWTVLAFLYELAAGRPAPWPQILTWALYSGATGAAFAWSFTHDLRALFIVAPLSFLLPSVFGEFWRRPLDVHRALVALCSLATTIVAYILFVRFIVKEATSTLRMRAEIHLARDIHARLVPPIAARTRRAEWRGASHPTTEVGGDLLDAISDASGDAVFLADVSGHGVPAGVLMAMIHSAIRVRARTGVPFAELVCDVNALVCESTEPRMFATFAAMRFDDRGVEYAIAGHPPILWYRAAERRVERLENEHPPLGILSGHAFTAARVMPAPGDAFLLFTDGLTEVRDARGEEFGEERLVELMQRLGHAPLAEIEAALLDAVRGFGRQEDDQTLLVVRTADSTRD